MRPVEVIRIYSANGACDVSGTTGCNLDFHRYVRRRWCDRVDVGVAGSCTGSGYRTTSNGECWHRAQILGWCDGDYVGRSDSVSVLGRSCDCDGGDCGCGCVQGVCLRCHCASVSCSI